MAEKKKSTRPIIGVATTGLNLREEPNTDSDILYVIPEGHPVVIVGENDDQFYNVMVEGLVGYCVKSYIEIKK